MEVWHGYHRIKVLVLAGLCSLLETPGEKVFSQFFLASFFAAFLGVWLLFSFQSQQWLVELSSSGLTHLFSAASSVGWWLRVEPPLGISFLQRKLPQCYGGYTSSLGLVVIQWRVIGVRDALLSFGTTRKSYPSSRAPHEAPVTTASQFNSPWPILIPWIVLQCSLWNQQHPVPYLSESLHGNFMDLKIVVSIYWLPTIKD